jgi:hypothetical protein
VDDDIDTVHGAPEAIPIPDVTDEKPEALVLVERLGHVGLNVLASAVYADAIADVVVQKIRCKRLTKTA